MTKRTNRQARRAPTNPAKALQDRVEREVAAKRDAKAREANPERWGEERASKDRIASLQARGVEVNVDQGGRIKNAVKVDIWSQMLTWPNAKLSQSHYNAVRRLQEDMAIRAGANEGGGEFVMVDRQGDAALVTDRMAEAGARVDDALGLVGPPSAQILRALLGVDVDGVDWRVVVEKLSGETNSMAQGAVLRQAARSLADVYDQVDAREMARWNARKDRLDAAGNGHMRASAA